MELTLKRSILAILFCSAVFAQSPGVTEVTVAYSATPVFTATAGITNFNITLTGNVSSSTYSSPAVGVGSFKICQDGTGSRTFVFPTNAFGFGTIDSTLNKCSRQTFKYDGTNIQATGVMLSDRASAPGGIPFTGSCSSSTYVRGDGSCQTVAAGGGSVTTSGSPTTNAFPKFTGSTVIGNTNLSEAADGSDLAAQALTSAAPSTPTFNVSGTTTCDLSLSNACKVAFTGTAASTTLAFSNPHGLGPYILESCQSAAGGGTYATFNTAFKNFNEPDPGAGTTNCTWQQFTYDGTTNYYAQQAQLPSSVYHGLGSAAVAFANFPTCSSTYNGFAGPVSDSTTAVLGATVTGGGSISVWMFCNSSNWKVMSPLSAASGSATLTIASGTVSLGTTAVASGACSSGIDGGTATGVLSTDVPTAAANASPLAVTGYTPATTGSLYTWAIPTADHVTFYLCNNTATSITPGSAVTLNWRVVR